MQPSIDVTQSSLRTTSAHRQATEPLCKIGMIWLFADKKEAKKAIEKLDLRIDHYDLAITLAKKSKEREVPSLEADLRKAQKQT